MINADAPLRGLVASRCHISLDGKALDRLPPVARVSGAVFVVSFTGWDPGIYDFHYAWQQSAHPEDPDAEDGHNDVQIDLRPAN